MARQKKNASPADSELETRDDAPNPVWFKPIMFGFMIVGFLWLITFYVSKGALPIAALESYNILIGAGVLFIGFLMTTRWR